MVVSAMMSSMMPVVVAMVMPMMSDAYSPMMEATMEVAGLDKDGGSVPWRSPIVNSRSRWSEAAAHLFIIMLLFNACW